MPELHAWMDHEPSGSHVADVLAEYHESHGGLRGQIRREQIPMLLHQAWLLRGTSKQWSSLLGLGLVKMAAAGNVQAVKQLLSAGAILTKADGEGFTPLHRAAASGHADVVAQLLDAEGECESRAPFSQPRLVFQPGQNGLKLVQAASMMRRGTVNTRNNAGYSPLHSAAASGNERVVRLLLDSNACPMGRNSAHKTPLHYAAQTESTGSIALLVARGGDVMAQDSAGRTPLHDAAVGGTEASTRALVMAGASTEVKARISGRTPLHEACAYLRPAIVRALLSLDADEGATDNDGSKPSDIVNRRMVQSDSNLVEAANAIRTMLERAPADRRWRHRGLLLLLRRHPQRAKLEARGVEWSRADSDLWRIVLGTAQLVDGPFREVVRFL